MGEGYSCRLGRADIALTQINMINALLTCHRETRHSSHRLNKECRVSRWLQIHLLILETTESRDRLDPNYESYNHK